MLLCFGFIPFMKLSLIIFFLLYISCGRQNIVIQEDAKDIHCDLTYHERECLNCNKKEQLFTETEHHKRRNFLKRKYVHCVLCGAGTFEVTQEI